MRQLVDDLLSFSKAAKTEVRKSIVDMNMLAGEVVREVENDEKEHAEMILHPLAPASGDASLLRQVVSNLVANAVKYSRKKEKPVVEIGSFEDTRGMVYYVRDNGVGFDMQYYDKLFGAFQRLHDSQDFEGTGVGLALVHRIIRKHGGNVWAEAKVNEGAIFYFSLPL